MSRLLRPALFILGIGVIIFLVAQAGPREVWQSITALGYLAPLALLPYAAVYCCDTLGWRATFPVESLSKLPILRFARIRWAGEATNYVIPTAYVGGEALKILLLKRNGIPAPLGTASAVTSKTCQTIAQVLFLGLAALLAIQHLPPMSPIRYGMMGVTALAGLSVAALLLIQRFGFFRLINGIADRLHLARGFFARQRNQIEQVDQDIRSFYRQSPRRFYASITFYLAGWLADTLEIWLVSHLIDMPITWTQACALEAFIGVAKILGMFVPGSLGVQESGVVALCHIFGLPVVFGTSYALLRRAREVFYAAGGWYLLYREIPSWEWLKQSVGSDSAANDSQ